MSDSSSESSGLNRKRIALFLDGTWNTVGDNTNAWRLKGLCAARSADWARQVIYYSKGVVSNFGERTRGGMLGYGLDRAITRLHHAAGAEDLGQPQNRFGTRRCPVVPPTSSSSAPTDDSISL